MENLCSFKITLKMAGGGMLPLIYSVNDNTTTLTTVSQNREPGRDSVFDEIQLDFFMQTSNQ